MTYCRMTLQAFIPITLRKAVRFYIHLDADIKNTQKQNLYCDEIYEVVADYNNGYTYNGHPIVDDATTGFTYANITGIDPCRHLGCII